MEDLSNANKPDPQLSESNSGSTLQISQNNQSGINTPQVVYSGEGAAPAPKRRVYIKYLVVIVIIVILLVGGGLFFWYRTRTSTAMQLCSIWNNLTTLNLLPPSDTSSYLVCTTTNGQNRVRYDLPTMSDGSILQKVTANNAARMAFFGYSYTKGQQTEYWLLNNHLLPEKQLMFPQGAELDTPTFSRDGKSLLLSLYNPTAGLQNSQIFSYNLQSEKLTQLTQETAYDSNQYPYETKDGHILYFHCGGSCILQPYLMNADGSDARQVADISSVDSTTNWVYEYWAYSFDPLSDSVLILGDSDNTNLGGFLWYENVSDLVAGKPLKKMYVATTNGQDTVIGIGNNSVVVDNTFNYTGNVYSLATGRHTGTITEFGSPVGMLDTTAFRRSATQ